jgi:hypothetical protein
LLKAGGFNRAFDASGPNLTIVGSLTPIEPRLPTAGRGNDPFAGIFGRSFVDFRRNCGDVQRNFTVTTTNKAFGHPYRSHMAQLSKQEPNKHRGNSRVARATARTSQHRSWRMRGGCLGSPERKQKSPEAISQITAVCAPIVSSCAFEPCRKVIPLFHRRFRVSYLIQIPKAIRLNV